MSLFFFFNDTATTEIYTLSLHDALPISLAGFLSSIGFDSNAIDAYGAVVGQAQLRDRKSTRLNSSHSQISYAVFCLKKKKMDEIVLVTMLLLEVGMPRRRILNSGLVEFD